MYGDFRSTNSAIACSARSTAASDSTTVSAGSASITALPGADVAKAVEDLGGVVAAASGPASGRTASPSAARASAARRVDAAGAVGDLDELGQLHDPRRDRDVVAGDLPRPALAVPPLVRARQRVAAPSVGRPSRSASCRARRGVLRDHVVDVAPTRDGELDAGADPMQRRAAAAEQAHHPQRLAGRSARGRTSSPSARCRRRTTSPARGRRSGSPRSRAARCSRPPPEPRRRARPARRSEAR